MFRPHRNTLSEAQRSDHTPQAAYAQVPMQRDLKRSTHNTEPQAERPQLPVGMPMHARARSPHHGPSHVPCSPVPSLTPTHTTACAPMRPSHVHTFFSHVAVDAVCCCGPLLALLHAAPSLHTPPCRPIAAALRCCCCAVSVSQPAAPVQVAGKEPRRTPL